MELNRDYKAYLLAILLTVVSKTSLGVSPF